MKFRNKYQINPELAHLFNFKSEKDKLKHGAKILMYRFFSEVERLSEDGKLQRKDFADAIDVSESFISQLYKGDKIVSLTALAKLEEAFDLTFEVEAKLNNMNIYEVSEIEINPEKKQQAKVVSIFDFGYTYSSQKTVSGS